MVHMSGYGDKRDRYLADAREHCKRAERFAALNVGLVLLTAALAAAAAVTSMTSVPTWIVTTTAALSAALGVVSAAFKPHDKSAEHTELAADLERLASEYGQLASRPEPIAEGSWEQALAKIENDLVANHPVDDEAQWAAAWPPSRAQV